MDVTTEAGAEVFSNYGSDKGNEKLLLTYGFCTDDNANDEYYVQLGVRGPLRNRIAGAMYKNHLPCVQLFSGVAKCMLTTLLLS